MSLPTCLSMHAKVYDYFKGVLYYYTILNNKN